ncbi:MAG: hypothetical protein ACRDY6_15065 [Acidimicrobiia bacterium]
MDVVVLTAVCTIALATGALFALRWGRLRTDRLRATTVGEMSGRQMLLRFLRVVAIGVAAGAASGVLVLGCGGRLVMRILAATSGDRAQGLLTEAEERVGEITFSGTFGFVVFIGIFGGIFGALVYLLVRRWLPGPAWVSGLVIGMLGLGFARLDPLDPGNIDFAILQPDWLAVLLLALLPLLYGVVVVSMIERLDRSYPTLAWRPGAILAHLPLLAVATFPPFIVGMILAGTVAAFTPRMQRLRRAWDNPALLRGGQALVGALAVAALGFAGAGVVRILT